MAIAGRNLTLRQIESELNERLDRTLADLAAVSPAEIQDQVRSAASELGLDAEARIEIRFERSTSSGGSEVARQGPKTVIIVVVVVVVVVR